MVQTTDAIILVASLFVGAFLARLLERAATGK